MMRDRFDIQPLLDAMVRNETPMPAPDSSAHRALMRGKAQGFLTAGQLDTLAVTVLGMHPSLLAGSDWWTYPDDPTYRDDPSIDELRAEADRLLAESVDAA